MATTEPIRNVEDVKAMMNFFKESGLTRNCCLLGLGVYTALRVGDMIRLTWGDVFSFESGKFKRHFFLVEQKTKKSKQVYIHEHLAEMLGGYMAELETIGASPAKSTYIFQSRKGRACHISRQTAYRIVREAAMAAEVAGHISCHSLRKTFGYAAHASGASPAVIMEIYNHSSYKETRRYLGIAQDERDAVYAGVTFR